MTLSQLQWCRKIAPFFVALLCVLPWLVIRPESLRDTWILVALILMAGVVGFFYVVLKIREPFWRLEKDRFVNAQIREHVIALIPDDLEVTPNEKQQLAQSEILNKLTGIFWEEIDHNEILHGHKQHFYSNGLEYTTAIDAAVLFTVFGCWYATVSFVLGTYSVLWGTLFCVGAALLSKYLAIPRARQHHLELSDEQLRLLKREARVSVENRFRNILRSWRLGEYVTARKPTETQYNFLPFAAFAGICVAIGYLLTSRGYFGLGPKVNLPTEVYSSYVNGGPHNKNLVVVFVHGVLGTKEDSWLNPQTANTFPKLLAEDPDHKDQLDVFVFEYFTPNFGAAPSIVDLSSQLRGDLDDNRVFENHHKVIFLAHSMGGIIVRQFLVSRQDRAAQVPMVFFYATPTNGSELAAVAKLASSNPQFRGLAPIENNDLLQSIQNSWLSSEKLRALGSYCAVETLDLYGVMAVTRSSASAMCNRDLDSLSANHIDIVKPGNRDDPRYRRFVTALRREAL